MLKVAIVVTVLLLAATVTGCSSAVEFEAEKIKYKRTPQLGVPTIGSVF